MYENLDGFKIAELDLELRGPGEVAGILQSGNLQLGIADLVRDRNILVRAKEDAAKILREQE
jgi:ATP-dependent DNA helicase RecG